jgi:hypothetical protein
MQMLLRRVHYAVHVSNGQYDMSAGLSPAVLALSYPFHPLHSHVSSLISLSSPALTCIMVEAVLCSWVSQDG